MLAFRFSECNYAVIEQISPETLTSPASFRGGGLATIARAIVRKEAAAACRNQSAPAFETLSGRRVPGARPGKTPYDRLRALGIVLPPAPAPVANFVTAVREGNLLFLAGQGPLEPNGFEHHGKVGADVTVEEAYQHARITAINMLAVMHDALGSLERVRRIVKVLGMVNAVPLFADHPKVINGCSDLFIAVFGEAIGRHARSAVGMGSLPSQITVEIEAVVAVD